MTYISKEQLKNIIDSAPQGTQPSMIVSGLVSRGHTIEGLDTQQPPTQIPVDNRDRLQKAGDFVGSIFPGKKLGEAVGTSIYGLSQKLKGNESEYQKSVQENISSFPKVAGDVISAVSTPLSLAVNPAKSALGAFGQFGALSATSNIGSQLSEKGNISGAEVLKTGVQGGLLGAGFNLLGRGISTLAKKVAPPTLEFTTGVPQKAISEAISNPTASKIGRTKTNVTELQKQAVTALKDPKVGLYRNLSDEFSDGIDAITKKYQPITQAIQETKKIQGKPGQVDVLVRQVNSLLNDFRLNTKTGIVNFDKSSIVRTAEKANIQQAVDTIRTWSDYTPKGIQTLAERIGALRKFETVSGTKESAILGKLYNKIAGNSGIIKSVYPELHTLRTNFANNTRVLDEINAIVGGSAKTPLSRQSAITRLSNLFKEDKETYINAIRLLSQRSGVDIIGQLAGTEFQKTLPTFYRGLGGGGAVAVGATLLNPWALLLAPLFSPRFIGSTIEKAPSIAKQTSQGLRAITTKTVSNSRE